MELSLRQISMCVVLVVVIHVVSSHPGRPSYYSPEDGVVARVVEIVPSAVTVRPRPRQRIRSEFAKRYWTSGNFFNRENFKAVPTLNDALESQAASVIVPRTLIFNSPMSLQDL